MTRFIHSIYTRNICTSGYLLGPDIRYCYEFKILSMFYFCNCRAMLSKWRHMDGVSWHFNSPSTPLFVQRFVQRYHVAVHDERNPTVDSPHEEIVTRKTFTCYDVDMCCNETWLYFNHIDVIKWKLFPCYWPFVRGIPRSPVNSPHKGPVMRVFMFLWCGSAWALKQTV